MFSEEQLNLIRGAARKVKNQGELAVFNKTLEPEFALMFSKQQSQIIKYCAEECKRQRSGEMSVYHMVWTWNFAYHYADEIGLPKGQINLDFIRDIGQAVEPDVNRKGFRTVQVGVNTNTGFKEFIHWQNIERNLTLLLESYYEGKFSIDSFGPYHNHYLSESAVDQFYYEYEMIHPFRDGNGRSGKIIYNYLLGSLDSPVMPPNFFEAEGGIP